MHSGKLAVLGLAAALFATSVHSYTYEVAPCINSVARRWSASDGLTYDYDYSCRSALTTLGVAGSSTSCTRSWGTIVIHFLLPEVSSGSVTGVTFSSKVSSPGGGGLPIVLHGLGLRSMDTSGASTTFHGGYPMNADYGYPLGESDYYCGTTDPASGSVLINEAYGTAGMANGEVLTENSDALRDYIGALLDAAPAGSQRYAALRISTDDYYGCDSACDSSCRFKRYKFDPKDISMTIETTDSASAAAPVSTWAYEGAAAGLEYKTSTESETLDDQIPDFSGVGYLYGADLPTQAEVGGQVVELAYQSGDQSRLIQDTIDGMALLPIDPATGFRGTVKLAPGVWQVSKTLSLGVSGVVLAGTIEEPEPTVISALEAGDFAVSAAERARM